MANIDKVELLPIAIPGDSSGECDGTVDTFVVRITDTDGVSGIGDRRVRRATLRRQGFPGNAQRTRLESRSHLATGGP